MTMVIRLTTLLLLSTTVLQVIPNVLAGTCTENALCVPENACVTCRQLKCEMAQSQGFGDVDCDTLSPLIGGNQCCDLALASEFSLRRKRQAYNFDADPQRKWPLPVGFAIDSTINSPSNIRNALRYIEGLTCIRFSEVPTSSAAIRITYTTGSSCTAYVGRSDYNSTPITLTSDCLSKFGDLVYYTVQTLGMWHQSQRADRDDYITVNTNNTDPSHVADFTKLNSNDIVTYGLPYDLASIQHFPGKIYTKNGDFTILTKDPLYEQTIGQRVQLSFQDAKLLNLMYCQNVCSSSSLNGVCQNGGYQDPKNCTECRCPDGFGGRLCAGYENTPGNVCGGFVTASPTEMSLTSPGYDSPRYYDSQISCAWNITAPRGGNISLRFIEDFGLYQDQSYACYHWVEVRYKGKLNNTGPRFCGQTLPQVQLTSDGSNILVIFQSNLSGLASTLQRGFKIAYKVVSEPPTTPPPTPPPPTSASPIPTSSTPAPPTNCNPNPCHNNGTCLLNGSRVTCTCINGFRGQYCTDGPCGGCNSSPGQADEKCIVPESPQRVCQQTYNVESNTGWWWGCSTRKRVVARNVTCTWSVCCDNARDVGYGCAVSGWTNWCPCPVPCGGGIQARQQFGFRNSSYGTPAYIVLSTEQQNCNTQKCVCDGSDDDDDGYPGGGRRAHKRSRGGRPFWWAPWSPPCQPCNGPTFVESNGQCSPA